MKPREDAAPALGTEFDLIRRHFQRAGSPTTPAVALGIGDDCALLLPSPGHQLAISSDMLVEGVHFFHDVAPEALGHKALAVNLSDLAAMGARPLGFTLALALPRADDAWLAAFSRGLFALADAHACPLVGGDTTRGPLNLCVTVFGEVAPGQALRRDAARAGDDVYVSGRTGEARLALDDSGRIIDATPFAGKLLTRADGNVAVEDLFGKKFSSIAGLVNLERAIEREGSTIKGNEGPLHFKLLEPAQKRSVGSGSTLKTAALPLRSKFVTTAKDGQEPSLNEILGSDPQVAEQLKVAQRVYSRCLPLLLQGESGVGKTLLAKSLHQAGPHSNGNFVAINCAAIPHDLIESELFGYRPGSFTGAAKQGS